MKHLLLLLPLLLLGCEKEEGRPLPPDGPLLLAGAPLDLARAESFLSKRPGGVRVEASYALVSAGVSQGTVGLPTSFPTDWLSIYLSFDGQDLTEAPEGTYRLLNGLGHDNTIPDFSLLSVTAVDDLEDDNFSEQELTTNGGEGTVELVRDGDDIIFVIDVELVPMSAINSPNPPPAIDLRGSVRVRRP